ncbi:MAG: peptidylprolyl isomerase [Pseudomonadota bacterium]
MLRSIRARSGSWIIKGLLALLILSFAAWGLGDIFLGDDHAPVVAQVGETDISSAQASLQFEQLVQRFGQVFGLDGAAAMSMGLGLVAVEQATTRTLLARAGQALDLQPSLARTGAFIAAQPAFTDSVTGRYNGAIFNQTAARLGFNPSDLIEEYRQTLLEQTVLALSAPDLTPPAPLLDALAQFEGETRTIAQVTVPYEAFDPGTPTDAQLARFLDERSERYAQQEGRIVELLTLRQEDFADEILDAIDPDEQADLVRAATALLSEPETRRLQQALAPDQETAQALASAWRAGTEPDEITELGPVDAEALLPETAAPAFALAKGAISEPIETLFGWTVLRIEDIIPARTPDPAQITAYVEQEIRLERALDRLFDVVGEVEDMLLRDTPLSNAAQSFGLTPQVQQIYLDGRNAQGTPIDSTIVQAIFALDGPGDTTLVEQTDDGTFFVAAFRDVIPAAPAELSQIRETLSQDWQDSERRRLAREAAQDFAERWQPNTSPPEDPLLTRATAPQTITRQEESLSQEDRTRIFAATPPQTLTISDEEGVRLVQVQDRHLPTANNLNTETRDQIQNGFRADLHQILLADLRGTIGVTFFDEAIDRWQDFYR